MAFYADEQDIWKCQKHPSKRRRSCGICPICLTDRLSALCPDCHRNLPCQCFPSNPSSSEGVGLRISALISKEPAFRRSSSVATARSRFGSVKEDRYNYKPSFWSFFKSKKEKSNEELCYQGRNQCSAETISGSDTGYKFDAKRAMARSRSVATWSATSSPAKGRGWYFPSPMKAFRHTKSSKVVQERSPLCRG